MWPITGSLSSYFSPSHPLGIDVDLYGRAGAPIAAARGGVVSFAGGNPCCSYGYYVEIDSTAFDDLAGNSYAGIAGATAWNFTSIDTTTPKAVTAAGESPEVAATAP